MSTAAELRARLRLYEAQTDAYRTHVAMYAEALKLEILYGYKKPRFCGDSALEGRETSESQAPSKCSACGSREFRLHDARRICAYCRQ